MVKRYRGGYIASTLYPVLPSQGGVRSMSDQVNSQADGSWPKAGFWYSITTGNTFFPHGLDVDNDGNVYVVGADNGGQGAGGLDAIIIKYSPDGQILWQRALGTGSAERAYCVSVSLDGTHLWVGGQTTAIGSTNGFIYKFSTTDGSVISYRTVGFSTYGIDNIKGVQALSNGGAITAGLYQNTASSANPSAAMWDFDGSYSTSRAWRSYKSASGGTVSAHAVAVSPNYVPDASTWKMFSVGSSNAGNGTTRTGFQTTIQNAGSVVSGANTSFTELSFSTNASGTSDISVSPEESVYISFTVNVTPPFPMLAKMTNTTPPTCSWAKCMGSGGNSPLVYSYTAGIQAETNNDIWVGSNNYVNSSASASFYALQRSNSAGAQTLTPYKITYINNAFDIWAHGQKPFKIKNGFFYLTARLTTKVTGTNVSVLETIYGQIIVMKLPADLSQVAGNQGVLNIAPYTYTPSNNNIAPSNCTINNPQNAAVTTYAATAPSTNSASWGQVLTTTTHAVTTTGL